MAEEGLQQSLFDAEINVKATTTGLDNASRAIDELTKKIENVQRKASQITSAFDKMFGKGHITNLTNEYEKLNQQLLKYQQNLQRVGMQQQQNQVRFGGGGTQYGGDVFANRRNESLQQQQLMEQKRLNRGQWIRWSANAAMNVSRGALQTGAGVAQNFANADFTGMYSNIMRGAANAATAIPIVGAPLSLYAQYKATRADVMKNLAMGYYRNESQLTNVRALSTQYNGGSRGMLFGASRYGYSPEEMTQATEAYLRAGGTGRNYLTLKSQARTARAFGLQFGNIAQTAGTFERYGIDSGNEAIRNIIEQGSRGGLKRQNMGEFLQNVTQAWQQAMAQGINIKNPEKIAKSMARLEKTGFTGVQARQVQQGMNQGMRAAMNVSSYGQVQLFRNVRRLLTQRIGRQATVRETMLQLNRGGTDELNQKALVMGLNRYKTKQGRFLELRERAQSMNLSASQIDKLAQQGFARLDEKTREGDVGIGIRRSSVSTQAAIEAQRLRQRKAVDEILRDKQVNKLVTGDYQALSKRMIDTTKLFVHGKGFEAMKRMSGLGSSDFRTEQQKTEQRYDKARKILKKRGEYDKFTEFGTKVAEGAETVVNVIKNPVEALKSIFTGNSQATKENTEQMKKLNNNFQKQAQKLNALRSRR